jgi:excisionase family DNA binding protein
MTELPPQRLSVTAREAAAQLGVTVGTIRRWHQAGALGSVRRGRRVPVDDVDRLADYAEAFRRWIRVRRRCGTEPPVTGLHPQDCDKPRDVR